MKSVCNPCANASRTFEPNNHYIGDNREIMRQMIAQGVKVQMCVTSPPYWGLRDYGVDGQLGLEPTPEAYVNNLVEVFDHMKAILADDGTLWLNLGDSYSGSGVNDGSKNPGLSKAAERGDVKKRPQVQQTKNPKGGIPTFGLKPKDLVGIPWMVAFALREAGWYLRCDIIWHKPNPMPESVRDRPTRAHEYIFLLSKSRRYYYDQGAIMWPNKPVTIERAKYNWCRRDSKAAGYENINGLNREGNALLNKDGANARSVWTVATHPYPESHFATFPPDLIKPCILAGSRPGDIVLDPFMGSGTTGQVAESLGRQWMGIELNPAYEPLIRKRTAQMGLGI